MHFFLNCSPRGTTLRRRARTHKDPCVPARAEAPKWRGPCWGPCFRFNKDPCVLARADVPGRCNKDPATKTAHFVPPRAEVAGMTLPSGVGHGSRWRASWLQVAWAMVSGGVGHGSGLCGSWPLVPPATSKLTIRLAGRRAPSLPRRRVRSLASGTGQAQEAEPKKLNHARQY